MKQIIEQILKLGLIPLVIGLLSSYSFIWLQLRILSNPKVKAYPNIVRRAHSHCAIIICSKEEVITNLKVNAHLRHKIYSIPIPLFNEGEHPILEGKGGLPIFIKLNKKFFIDIQQQQNTYLFIEPILKQKLDSFILSLSAKTDYDEYDRNQQDEAKDLFKKLFNFYGMIRVVISLDNPSTGLRKPLVFNLAGWEEIQDWSEIKVK